MNKIIVKFISSILIFSSVLSITTFPVLAQESNNLENGLLFEEEHTEPEEEGDIVSDETPDPIDESEKIPIEQLQIMNEFREDLIEDIEKDSSSRSATSVSGIASNRFADNKIIVNSSDLLMIEQSATIYKYIPNLFEDIQEFARLTGKGEEELEMLKISNYDAFKKLAQETGEKYFSDEYIKKLLLSKPEAIAQLLGLNSTSHAIQEMRNNPDEVDAALDSAISNKYDKKVIETLNYLVRPKDDPRGGAGHWKIKIDRIKKNYSRESSRESRESVSVTEDNEKALNSKKTEGSYQTIESVKAEDNIDNLEDTAENIGLDNNNSIVAGQVIDNSGQTVSDFLVNSEESPKNISAHNKGMAVDISEIDEIRCTKIEKKRIGSDKKTAQPPYNIKLLWQTTEGYAQDRDALNTSFNQMMWNMSQDALLDMLSELNIDFNNIGSLDSSNFSEILTVVGQAFFAQILNAPENGVWNFNLEETLRKVGGVLIADELGMDRGPFLDSDILSVDSLTEAIGRANIEKRLGLPYGSLIGANRKEMIESLGKSRILHEFGLPHDVLETQPQNQDDLMQKIGARVFETGLSLNKWSAYSKSSYSEMREANGKYKIDALFSLPNALDNQFGIPEGTSKRLKTGSISMSEYNRSIAASKIIEIAHAYGNYSATSNPSYTATTTANNIKTINWRDEMLNLPEGTADKFLNNQLGTNDYYEIGIFSLSRTMENSELGRQNISSWLRNPSQDFIVSGVAVDPNDPSKVINTLVTLPLNTYASILGVSTKEVYLLIGSDKEAETSGMYKRIGKKILTQAILNSSIVQETKNRLINNSPELQEGIRMYEFYKERYDNIKNHLPELKKKAESLKSSIEAINSSVLGEQEKNDIIDIILEIGTTINNISASDSIESIMRASTSITESANSSSSALTRIYDLIAADSNARINDIETKANSYKYELDYIAKNAYEILTGKEQTDFRFEDIQLREIHLSQITLAGVSISGMELALMLSGKIPVEDFLVSIGSAKIAEELNLPPMALKYAANLIIKTIKEKKNPKDAFFKAIGLATLEAKTKSSLEDQAISYSDDMAETSTIVEFRDKFAAKLGGNTTKANAIIAQSFNLEGYNLEYLIRGDFGAWSSARQKAEQNDKDLNIPIGTTESFIKGKELFSSASATISDTEYREMATKMGISESSLKLLVAHSSGEENPAVNQIYFVDKNQYLTTTDTADACTGKPIPDNVFMYYDQDGMHHFNSYPEANEYVKNNEEKKIDYIQDIIRGLSNIAGKDPSPYSLNDEQVKRISSSINSFVEGKRNSVLSGPDIPTDPEVYFGISTLGLNVKGDISTNLYEKFFTRGSFSSSDMAVGVDMWKTIGYSVVKKFAASYIGQSLGINIGSSRITADDFYEIFNGNSREVFARVGGQLLDTEIGTTRGTFEGIISATNSASRKCAMERAATELLGKYINIPGLKLDGSLFDNFGGSRIERLLGFPEGSFKGTNILDLLDKNKKNYVPMVNFYSAFNIPVPYSVTKLADMALENMGENYVNSYKNASFHEKSKIISNYVEAIGVDQLSKINSYLWFDWIAIDAILKGNLTIFLKQDFLEFSNDVQLGAELSNHESYKQYSSENIIKMIRLFKGRISSIDSALGIKTGTTVNLLLDKITPDQYRKEVSTTTIENIGVEVIKKAFGIEADISLADVRQFKDAITGDLSYSGAFGTSVEASTSQRLSVIYGFLDRIFSLKLDEKAGFEQGTFANIIQDPKKALFILLDQGAKRMDSQLGIQDKSINFSRFVEIYTNSTDPEKIQALCVSVAESGSSFIECMNSNSYRIGSQLRAEAENIISTNISNFLTDVSGVDIEITRSSTYPVQRTWTEINHNHGAVTLTLDQIKDVFKGDFRVLGVVGAIRGIGAILGDNDQKYALGNNSSGFLFNAQDIVDAFYGDPLTEHYASERARQEVYYLSSSGLASPTESAADDDTFSNIPMPYGTQTITPGNGAFYTASNSRDATIQYANMTYNIPTGVTVSAPTRPAEPIMPMPETYLFPPGGPNPTHEEAMAQYERAMENYRNDMNAYQMRLGGYNNTMERADRAAAEAAAMDRKLKRELFEYRVADCMLRKIDEKIPAGFTWAMMKGNAFVRTTMLINYIENWLRSDEGWAKYLPPGSLSSIYDYFSGPNKGNIDLLINNTTGNILNIIDGYLIKNSPNILGITFAPGTAQGLFAFIKTGNINDPVAIGGTNYSLSSVYKNYTKDFIGGKLGSWADEKLGLPAGTSYGVYRAYKSFKSAKDALSIIKEGAVITRNLASLTGLKEGEVINQANIDKAKSGVQGKMVEFKAEIVTIIITAVFSKQIAKAEESLGLVPGTGAIAVGIAVSYLMGAAINPMAIVLFVALNLFGVYKVEYICTADGYYPAKEAVTDASKWDNGNLGTFDGMNENIRKEKFIEAAQYKADRLALDLYEMPDRTGDKDLVPLQVMTGRIETVIQVKENVLETACKKINRSEFNMGVDGTETAVCLNSNVGIWQNLGNVKATHIAF